MELMVGFLMDETLSLALLLTLVVVLSGVEEGVVGMVMAVEWFLSVGEVVEEEVGVLILIFGPGLPRDLSLPSGVRL
jgi:hypothetical protein